jgi:2-(1,2-epoxy-1,2-dihydrophenyl)acetyl-CoA isomerase
MTDTPFVLVTDTGPVRWITLNRPDRKNAVPLEGWAELADAFDDFASSVQRVVVLRGAGEDFCAGADLHFDTVDELRSPAVGRAYMRAPGRAVTALYRLAKPSLAAVDGVAAGGGMNLALGCDIVVATEQARFSEIFVKRGLTVDLGGTWLLPRIVGMARARELALTGRTVAATEALEIGMVSRVVPVGELVAVVQQLAEEIAEGAPLAQSFIKKALSRSMEMTFEQALASEAQAQAALLASDDVREGVAAFLERRDPRFEGK